MRAGIEELPPVAASFAVRFVGCTKPAALVVMCLSDEEEKEKDEEAWPLRGRDTLYRPGGGALVGADGKRFA